MRRHCYYIATRWRDIRGIYLAPKGRRHCAPQLRAGKSIIFSPVPPGAGAINGPAAAAALSHGGGGGDDDGGGGGDRHTPRGRRQTHGEYRDDDTIVVVIILCRKA